ncbi:MAG: hypothetical protein AAFV33_14260, partial [Chloroflexota bacterium]
IIRQASSGDFQSQMIPPTFSGWCVQYYVQDVFGLNVVNFPDAIFTYNNGDLTYDACYAEDPIYMPNIINTKFAAMFGWFAKNVEPGYSRGTLQPCITR